MTRLCTSFTAASLLTCFLAFQCFGAVHSLSPKFIGYNPLESSGYQPLTQWEEFSNNGPVSAVVADFTHPDASKECVRVVVFTAKDSKLGFMQAPCGKFKLTMGLIDVDDALWYYGTAMAKKDASAKYLMVSITDAATSTCKKTIIDEINLSADPRTDVKCVFDGTVKGSGPEADEDCQKVLEVSTRMQSSHFGGKAGDNKDYGPSTFLNPKELLGAETKMYMKGPMCFRHVRFYSKGRPMNAMSTVCGPMQRIVMTEKVFYLGRSAMIKVDDKDTDTFHLFLDHTNGLIPTDDSLNHPGCEKRTFKLIKRGAKYRVKRITSVTEYQLSAECRDFLEGKIQGNTEVSEKIYELADASVDEDLSFQLKGYEKIGMPSDYNARTELGAIVYLYKIGASKLKVLFIISQEVVLTGAVLGADVNTETLTIKDGVLTHDKDVIARREPNGDVTVINRVSPSSCTKKTFVLKTSNGKYSKERTGKETVDSKNNDCKFLLTQGTKDTPSPAADDED